MVVERAALKSSVRFGGRCYCRLGVAALARGFHRMVHVRADLAEREHCRPAVTLLALTCPQNNTAAEHAA